MPHIHSAQFDAMPVVQDIIGTQLLQCTDPDKDGPGTCQTDANEPNRYGRSVSPTPGQIEFGPLQIPFVEGVKPVNGCRIKEVMRFQSALSQTLFRYITPSVVQIFG